MTNQKQPKRSTLEPIYYGNIKETETDGLRGTTTYKIYKVYDMPQLYEGIAYYKLKQELIAKEEFTWTEIDETYGCHAALNEHIDRKYNTKPLRELFK